jgi:hypothetical protein
VRRKRNLKCHGNQLAEKMKDTGTKTADTIDASPTMILVFVVRLGRERRLNSILNVLGSYINSHLAPLSLSQSHCR